MNIYTGQLPSKSNIYIGNRELWTHLNGHFPFRQTKNQLRSRPVQLNSTGFNIRSGSAIFIIMLCCYVMLFMACVGFHTLSNSRRTYRSLLKPTRSPVSCFDSRVNPLPGQYIWQDWITELIVRSRCRLINAFCARNFSSTVYLNALWL